MATGALPFHAWHALALAAMALVVVVTLARRPPRGLGHPQHVRELAAIVRGQGDAGSRIRVTTTSLGVSVSAGTLERGGSRVRHYSLSDTHGGMSERRAAALTTLVARLAGAPDGFESVHGGDGVVHLLLPPGRGQP